MDTRGEVALVVLEEESSAKKSLSKFVINSPSSHILYNKVILSILNKCSLSDVGIFLSNNAKLEITRQKSIDLTLHFSYKNFKSSSLHLNCIYKNVSIQIASNENKKSLFCSN